VKAVVATRYGSLDSIAIVDRADPTPGLRDVRIAVRAASLNPIDPKIVRGKLRMVLALRPPIALGCDVAGVVDQVGSDVGDLRVGDQVYARLEKARMGGLATHVLADYAVVARKPANASFVEAAAIPLAALTALQALREVAALSAGQRVLIHAGAGGVGTFAIQIAKRLGLHVATTTSARNAEFVRELGADEVIDYTRDEPLPSGLDAVFDTLGTTEVALDPPPRVRTRRRTRRLRRTRAWSLARQDRGQNRRLMAKPLRVGTIAVRCAASDRPPSASQSAPTAAIAAPPAPTATPSLPNLSARALLSSTAK
jgi:NADPH:quinone reductase-like Zn-dependent oxidoreductase